MRWRRLQPSVVAVRYVRAQVRAKFLYNRSVARYRRSLRLWRRELSASDRVDLARQEPGVIQAASVQRALALAP